jgi:hypothetical protein
LSLVRVRVSAATVSLECDRCGASLQPGTTWTLREEQADWTLCPECARDVDASVHSRPWVVAEVLLAPEQQPEVRLTSWRRRMPRFLIRWSVYVVLAVGGFVVLTWIIFAAVTWIVGPY